MPGRHQVEPGRRPRLRSLIALAGGGIIGAMIFAVSSSATASSDPVTATFGVTGVATSNCALSVGGTDVYVAPGQELDVKSSVLGLTVLGAPLDLSNIASLDGSFTIDPGTANAVKLGITNTVQKVNGLSTGNHKWTWTVSAVKLLGGLKVPLNLSSSALAAGAKLTWNGTIHVTSDAAKCGIVVALPSVSASVSVTGLPPINVGIPGVTVTVANDLPKVPVPSSSSSAPGDNNGGGDTSSAPPPNSGNKVPVPAKVVPGPDVPGFTGGFNAGVLPGVGNQAGDVANLAPVAAPSANAPATNGFQQQNSTGKHKTIDLASTKSSTGQLSVVLAIIAIIALTLVAATYARLYLVRHDAE